MKILGEEINRRYILKQIFWFVIVMAWTYFIYLIGLKDISFCYDELIKCSQRCSINVTNINTNATTINTTDLQGFKGNFTYHATGHSDRPFLFFYTT